MADQVKLREEYRVTPAPGSDLGYFGSFRQYFQSEAGGRGGRGSGSGSGSSGRDRSVGASRFCSRSPLSALNIAFSNGDRDPWSAGGVVGTANESLGVSVIAIEGGAHHLDLRYSDPRDPPAAVAARAEEERLARKWAGLGP
eukprot:g887.t1